MRSGAADLAHGRAVFRLAHRSAAELRSRGAGHARELMAVIAGRYVLGAGAGRSRPGDEGTVSVCRAETRPPGQSLSFCSAFPATSAIGCTAAGRSARSVRNATRRHPAIEVCAACEARFRLRRSRESRSSLERESQCCLEVMGHSGRRGSARESYRRNTKWSWRS